jgi:DnaJ-class molecular chaperone
MLPTDDERQARVRRLAELLGHMKPCVECLGQGLCYTCQGDGRIKRREPPLYTACDACPGDGKCQECYGIGLTYQPMTL